MTFQHAAVMILQNNTGDNFMDATNLLYPTAVLVLLTVIVAFSLMFYRFYLVSSRQLSPAYFRFNRDGKPPARHDALADNYRNLFEFTILYYAVVAIAIATQQVTPALTGLAWAYVGFRIVHSIIHIGYNHVLYRLAAFLGSVIVVIAMWVILLIHITS